MGIKSLRKRNEVYSMHWLGATKYFIIKSIRRDVGTAKEVIYGLKFFNSDEDIRVYEEYFTKSNARKIAQLTPEEARVAIILYG